MGDGANRVLAGPPGSLLSIVAFPPERATGRDGEEDDDAYCLSHARQTQRHDTLLRRVLSNRGITSRNNTNYFVASTCRFCRLSFLLELPEKQFGEKLVRARGDINQLKFIDKVSSWEE